MSVPLYEKHEVCDGKGCHLCKSTGFIEIGLTRGQVDRLVEAAMRLEFRLGDIVLVRPKGSDRLVLFAVTSIDDGRLFGSFGINVPSLISAPARDCRRVGRIDRKEGEAC